MTEEPAGIVDSGELGVAGGDAGDRQQRCFPPDSFSIAWGIRERSARTAASWSGLDSRPNSRLPKAR